jgi:predicted DNA-binding transcriptional regulator AlpA
MPASPVEISAPLLVPVGEVARLTGLSERTIWAMSASGEMPSPEKCKARRLWSYTKLVAWVDGGCQPVQGAGR